MLKPKEFDQVLLVVDKLYDGWIATLKGSNLLMYVMNDALEDLLTMDKQRRVKKIRKIQCGIKSHLKTMSGEVENLEKGRETYQALMGIRSMTQRLKKDIGGMK